MLVIDAYYTISYNLQRQRREEVDMSIHEETLIVYLHIARKDLLFGNFEGALSGETKHG